ncbi:MAG: glycosyltransferase family 4 protein [Bacteroidetes bacterium]|nr:glycosyltransferase family 4 protein [Bacteroidota bacterium]
MRAIHILRKRDPRFFSLESVFEHVRQGWSLGATPEVWELPKPGFSLWNCVFLWLKARRAPGDTVFHVTGDALYAVFGLPRRRTTLTVHDCVFVRQRYGVRRWLILTLTLDWPVRYCRRVTAISDKTKLEIIRLTGCAPRRIVVIPNPISPHIRYLPAHFHTPCPRLLFMGITPNKNLPRVIQALEGLNVHLTVIGRLDESQSQLLKMAGFPYENIHGLSAEEVAHQYTSCDVVLLPSLYEGFGLPVVEGFQAGRPVVTSHLSPMSDIAGDAACLVDPEDIGSIRAGILRVCSDSQYREELVQKGLTKALQYQPAVIAKAYASHYQALLQEAG